MDLNNLSKEELVALLKSKEDKIVVSTPRCKFAPIRSDRKPCTDEATTKYGFCKKHSTTLQARREREAMEDDLGSKELVKEAQITPPKNEGLLRPEDVIRSQELSDQSFRGRELYEEPRERGGHREEPRERERTEFQNPVHTPRSSRDVVPKQPKKKIIRPNKWYRYEDPVTKIVFDPHTKKAYGVQDYETGKVFSLTKHHIDLCRKYGWKYDLQPGVIQEDEDLGDVDSDDYSDSDDDSIGEYQYGKSWASDTEEPDLEEDSD